MLDQVEKILQENSLCVLCTEANGNPYCSLMTYILMDDLRTLYMISTLKSRKYKNLLANPNVSVLIDTRQKPNTTSTKKIISVTFAGIFQPLKGSESQKVRTNLANNHSELDDFLKDPNCAIFSVKLKSFLLLDGPIDSYAGNL